MVVDHRFLEKHGARSAPSTDQIAGVAGAMSRQRGESMSNWEAMQRGRKMTRLIVSVIALLAAILSGGALFMPRGFWGDLIGSGTPAPAPTPSQGP